MMQTSAKPMAATIAEELAEALTTAGIGHLTDFERFRLRHELTPEDADRLMAALSALMDRDHTPDEAAVVLAPVFGVAPAECRDLAGEIAGSIRSAAHRREAMNLHSPAWTWAGATP